MELVRVFKAAIERQKVEREMWSDLGQDYVYSRQSDILLPTCVDGQKSFSMKLSEDKDIYMHLYGGNLN